MYASGAIGKMYALASAAFEKCGVWEQSYKINRDTANSAVELVYGEEEVSSRVADFATSGGDVSNSIGKVNEVTSNLVQNCGYTEDLVSKVLGGGINQNIIDSIEIYKGSSIKAVPIFGNKLTSYSTLAAQKVNSGLQEAYNGLVSKLGVVAHDVPTYVANKTTSAVSSAGGDDASLILGLAVGSVIGLGAYLGKKMKDSGLFYDGK